MVRAALIACLPWLAALVVALIALRGLLWLCGTRPNWRRIRRLHREQTGGVQSLSFVLAAPFFIMLLLLIVQISQVMVALVVVNHAAYVTARAAIVWIPASVGWIENGVPHGEGPNVIHWLQWTGTRDGHPTAKVTPGERKYNKIHEAAVLACMSIAPSHSNGGDQASTNLANSLTQAYLAYSPRAEANTRVPGRLANKLAYSWRNTSIDIEVLSPSYYDDQGLLVGDDFGDDWHASWEPGWDHVGWRDQITVTVKHDYALIPGPARILARRVYGGNDTVADRLKKSGSYSVVSLSATATLGNEGERSGWNYAQPDYATNIRGAP